MLIWSRVNLAVEGLRTLLIHVSSVLTHQFISAFLSQVSCSATFSVLLESRLELIVITHTEVSRHQRL